MPSGVAGPLTVVRLLRAVVDCRRVLSGGGDLAIGRWVEHVACRCTASPGAAAVAATPTPRLPGDARSGEGAGHAWHLGERGRIGPRQAVWGLYFSGWLHENIARRDRGAACVHPRGPCDPRRRGARCQRVPHRRHRRLCGRARSLHGAAAPLAERHRDGLRPGAASRPRARQRAASAAATRDVDAGARGDAEPAGRAERGLRHPAERQPEHQRWRADHHAAPQDPHAASLDRLLLRGARRGSAGRAPSG